MALQIADRVQVTATANTTVSFTLGSAVTGYQSFATAGITNGNTVFYGSSDGTNWEVGIGIYSSTGPTLTRSTILSSSNSGSAVSTFGSSVNVWIDYPSAQAVYNDPINGVVTPSTSLFNNNIVDKQLYLQGGNNLGLYSQDYSQASWTKNSATITTAYATAPDGTSTANRVVFTAGATSSTQIQQTYTATLSGLTLTVSAWVKSNTGASQTFQLKLTQAGVADHYSADQTATTSWQRFTYTFTFAAGGTGAIIGVANGSDSLAKDLQVWGIQLELGSVASSYTPTTSAIVTTTNNISVPSGSITTSADSTFNTVKVGLGGGSVSTNMAVGYQALNATNTTGSINNVGVGYQSLLANTTGNQNVAIGNTTLTQNTVGYQNTAVGHGALYQSGTSAVGNTAIGNLTSLFQTGNYNTTVGYQVCYATGNNSSNGTFVGSLSGRSNTTGSNNVAFGYSSLYNNTTAPNLTALGYQSLYNNTTNVATLGTITGGTGYTAGTYTGVVMTLSSGSTAITYPTATIVVSGGAVTSVTLTSNGVGFKDTTTVLTAPAASIGGTGSGFSVPVATLQSGTLITAVGYQALLANTVGNTLVAVGTQALSNNTTGYASTAVGVQALQNQTTAGYNTAVGASAGQAVTTGQYITVLGANALKTASTTSYMTAIGYNAGQAATGSATVLVGSRAGQALTSGTGNTALGEYALGSITTNSNCIGIGQNALQSATGGNNTAVGHQAGYAGTALTTGSNNIFIGYQAQASTAADTNEIVIGYNQVGNGSNTTTIGNSSTTQTYIAAGTLNAPQVNASNGFHVNSQTVSVSYAIPSGSSAMSAGPITVSSGVTVTVPSGSRWVVV